MELRSVLLALVVLCGIGLVSAAVTTDSYGNTVNADKTITWVSPPVNLTYQTTNSYSEDGLELLFSFARSFVNTVQPNAFPFGKLFAPANTINMIINTIIERDF